VAEIEYYGTGRRKSATARTDAEIRMLASGCESYKTDNGGYPQDSTTDSLDPRISGSPLTEKWASRRLMAGMTMGVCHT